MGLVKRLLDANGDISVSFICPNEGCESEVEGEVEDADFDYSNDSPGDAMGVSTAVLTCPECGTEYDLTLTAGPTAKTIELDDFPDVEVDFEDNTYARDRYDSEYDDFLAQWEPAEPGEIFLAAVNELESLDYGSTVHPQGKDAFYRMLFVQYIVLLEAYLSDRLISTVVDDEACLLRLVGAEPQLRAHQPKLIDIAKDRDYVKNHVKAFLQRASFHNLESVAPYFKAVFGVEIFESDAAKSDLVNAIETRHHLVHRNGRKNDGTYVVIGDNEVSKVKSLMRTVFDRVESGFSSYAAARLSDRDTL